MYVLLRTVLATGNTATLATAWQSMAVAQSVTQLGHATAVPLASIQKDFVIDRSFLSLIIAV